MKTKRITKWLSDDGQEHATKAEAKHADALLELEALLDGCVSERQDIEPSPRGMASVIAENIDAFDAAIRKVRATRDAANKAVEEVAPVG